jgi:hypothetical protein
MSTSTIAESGTEILARAIVPQGGDIPVDAARVFLSFRLDPTDENRVNELAERARDGSLSGVEREELDEYERVTALLELIQSKARLALKRAGELP